MIELHGARTGNCLRVAIALEEAGLPYEARRVDLRQGEQLRPAHLSLNPSGKVPTIVETNPGSEPFVLSQSVAILFYIDGKVPGLLFPTSDLLARSRTLERFFYFITDVIVIRQAASRLDSRSTAHLELMELAFSSFLASERFLASSRFMAGNSFTAADIAAVTFVQPHERQLNWAAYPELSRWYEETMNRPSVKIGLSAFDR